MHRRVNQQVWKSLIIVSARKWYDLTKHLAMFQFLLVKICFQTTNIKRCIERCFANCSRKTFTGHKNQEHQSKEKIYYFSHIGSLSTCLPEKNGNKKKTVQFQNLGIPTGQQRGGCGVNFPKKANRNNIFKETYIVEIKLTGKIAQKIAPQKAAISMQFLGGAGLRMSAVVPPLYCSLLANRHLICSWQMVFGQERNSELDMKERYTAIFDDDDDGERTKKRDTNIRTNAKKKTPKQTRAAT